jgi:hypothetical protein
MTMRYFDGSDDDVEFTLLLTTYYSTIMLLRQL